MNNIKKNGISIFYTVVFLFIFHQSFATVFTTINEGDFNNPIIWQGGQVPILSANDTVVISTCVNFFQDLFITGNTRFIIDANGFLCGHEDIFVSGNSVFEIFGKINYDTLKATSGHLNFDNNGQHNNGAVIIVGGTATITVNMFNKTNFPYICPCINTSVSPIDLSHQVFLYPNPSNSIVNISLSYKISTLFVLNVTGELLATYNDPITSTIDLSPLSPGIYFFKMRFHSGLEATCKLIMASTNHP